MLARMRGRLNPGDALVKLTQVGDATRQRAEWRSAIAALSRGARVAGPPPLDTLDPEQLTRAARLALDAGLADDMDWIAPASAAIALYELSAALPPGAERRDFGRRVFARLYKGTATTFAAVAGRMALGSFKPLESATMRARIALIIDLPAAAALNSGPLALSIVGRRELALQWVDQPSTGALPARRMAARLLERAAREAATRYHEGDSYPKDLMQGPSLRPAFDRLLADREPLVWRHAAVARGLLASVDAKVREDVELGLDPTLTPTEWRRAAVSLAVCAVSDRETVVKQCRKLLAGDIGEKDPGIAAAMVWSLPTLVESEPDTAEEMLDWLTASRRLDVAEALVALMRDVTRGEFSKRAGSIVTTQLGHYVDDADPIVQGVTRRHLDDLERSPNDVSTVSDYIRRALTAFETEGAREAHALAQDALARAERTMSSIEAISGSAETHAEVFGLLADLDSSVLERARLSDLILLGRPPGESDASVPEMDGLYDRISAYILDSEEKVRTEAWSRSASTAQRRRLVALLHLIDAETTRRSDGKASDRLRQRGLRALNVLMQRLTLGPDATVHRVLCATLARSFDAAVREHLVHPTDLILFAADHLSDRQSLEMLAEAAINPEVASPLKSYAKFVGATGRQSMDSIAEGSFDFAEGPSSEDAAVPRRIVMLSRGIGADGSYRSEALRQVVLRIGRALEAVSSARGLSELVDTSGTGVDPVGELEESCDAFRQLLRGARRRVGQEDGEDGIDVVADIAPMSALLERAVNVGVPANSGQIAAATSELARDLPVPLAAGIATVLARLGHLPIAPPSDVYAIPLQKRRVALPDWLLPRRTIGGFYVVRALGAGGVSSVFVARRIEERHSEGAETFALKVPEYDPSTARSLSEQEFMQMFRDEAGALLQLPQHQNLARFVTFDLASRPKPILVMELIRGVALDRLIRSGSLSTVSVFGYLDGILAGLESMHGAGVGHLDIKPSNVILRNGLAPVLVDFGLSGRHLRPGCGTLEYCAPEVLGVIPEGHDPEPGPADMYAFSALAFEMLTTHGLVRFQRGNDAGQPARQSRRLARTTLGAGRKPEVHQRCHGSRGLLATRPEGSADSDRNSRSAQRRRPRIGGRGVAPQGQPGCRRRA